MSRSPSFPAAARRLLTAIAAICAGSCTVGPDFEVPVVPMPEQWHTELDAGLHAGAAVEAAWWRVFEDPLLTQVVETALEQNKDLRQSLLRLDASWALRGAATAGQWPSITGTGSYQHLEQSKNTPFGAFIPSTDIHSAGFDAGWELDLWGRVRRSVEAADRDLEASAAEVQAGALTVAAEVARTYVELRAAQRRLGIAEENLALQQRTLELVRARLDAGLVVERDVAQARTNVETTRSRIPSLQSAAATAENRLAVLLGRAPGALPEGLRAPGEVPSQPAFVAVGAPADLLRRRPDVRRAERQFAAEVARVGIAEAERYPQFSLAGSLGLSSNGPEKFFDPDSFTYGIGPSLRWNLFDGGRLKNRVRALEATAEAAQVAYEQAVLLAIEETENALGNFVREQVRRRALGEAAREARRAVELAQTQYREGLSDFQTVLDSERIVATIEDDLAASDAAVASNLIALFKALGGGFDVPDGEGVGSAVLAGD